MNTQLGGPVPYSDKLKIFGEHIKTVLTLSSASLPVIVALLGMLVGKEASGGKGVQIFLQQGASTIVFSLASFLIAIVAGVVYNFLLCKDANDPRSYAGKLDAASIVMHGAFLAGVGSFFWFAYKMVQFYR